MSEREELATKYPEVLSDWDKFITRIKTNDMTDEEKEQLGGQAEDIFAEVHFNSMFLGFCIAKGVPWADAFYLEIHFA